jgi:hypothetical protein
MKFENLFAVSTRQWFKSNKFIRQRLSKDSVASNRWHFASGATKHECWGLDSGNSHIEVHAQRASPSNVRRLLRPLVHCFSSFPAPAALAISPVPAVRKRQVRDIM